MSSTASILPKAVNFYSAAYPRSGDVVFVEVGPQHDTRSGSVEVVLLEYGGLVGIIPGPEVSPNRKKSSSIKGLVPGTRFAAEVLAIDARSNGKVFVDISKRSVHDDSVSAQSKERFEKAVVLNRVLSECACHCHLNEGEVISQVAWPHYAPNEHALDVLLALADCPSEFDQIHPDPEFRRILHSLLLDIKNDSDDQDKLTVEDRLTHEVCQLLQDVHKRLDSADEFDLVQEVQVKLLAICHADTYKPNDCAMALVSSILKIAFTIATKSATQHQQQQQPISTTATRTLPCKLFLGELKTQSKLWSRTIRQFWDTRNIQLIPKQPKVLSGQVEIMGLLVDFFVTHATQATWLLPRLFLDVVYIFYDKSVDLLDEDIILVWFQSILDKPEEDSDEARFFANELQPMVKWLKDN
eukprot:c6997_g1_i1.p1 GENE.c6997_g1_i1~~c6997_g1_i1.p1  ORF type:complete len:412 (-),score=93.00 c6997_g1_i1:45-1280(-)